MEECSLLTVPTVAFSWATSLDLGSLGERGPHDPTVHICTTLRNRCMTGDTTLSSHKILKQRIRYVRCSNFELVIQNNVLGWCISIAGCKRPLWPFCQGGSYPTDQIWAQWNHIGHSCGRTSDKGRLENNTTFLSHCEWPLIYTKQVSTSRLSPLYKGQGENLRTRLTD